jgi:DNA replication protein DnaC
MNTDAIDAGRLTLALNNLRPPTIKTIWPDFAARADKEGWPAARFLASLAEHEMAERANRRIRRNVEEARLTVENGERCTSKRPSPNSTSIICSSSTTSPM